VARCGGQLHVEVFDVVTQQRVAGSSVAVQLSIIDGEAYNADDGASVVELLVSDSVSTWAARPSAIIRRPGRGWRARPCASNRAEAVDGCPCRERRCSGAREPIE
jgi:hypothetical protein